jgi:hypothetical protein
VELPTETTGSDQNSSSGREPLEAPRMEGTIDTQIIILSGIELEEFLSLIANMHMLILFALLFMLPRRFKNMNKEPIRK